MTLLKELFDLAATRLDEAKDQTLVIKKVKPRAKQVNDVLRSKKGGRMKSATDFDRSAIKRETRKMTFESDDADCCYFWYEVSWEVKNRSGEGPEAFDRHDRGVLKADTKEDAIAKVKSEYKGAMKVRVGKATKADYDKATKDD